MATHPDLLTTVADLLRLQRWPGASNAWADTTEHEKIYWEARAEEIMATIERHSDSLFSEGMREADLRACRPVTR